MITWILSRRMRLLLRCKFFRVGFLFMGWEGQVGLMGCSDPLRLSRFLLEECRKRGVQLHQPAEATSVVTDEGGKMTGLKVKQSDGTETEGKISALHSTKQTWNLITFSQYRAHPSSSQPAPGHPKPTKLSSQTPSSASQSPP